MKNKKLIISFIACALAFGAFWGYSSMNKESNYKSTVVILDPSTTDGSEITDSDSQVLEIDDEETPLASIGKSDKSKVRNLNSSELSQIRGQLADLVNKERKTGAANKLVVEVDVLEKTGDVRAKEIVEKWSHTRPNGKSWSTVLTAYGISTSNLKAGEDLAKISTTAKESYSEEFLTKLSDTIHETLMNSPTHKKVILNQDYDHIGVGIYSEVKNGKVTVYVTEHFKNNSSAPKKTSVSKLKISGVPSTKVYTGKAIKPAITVKNGSTKLKSGTDYTVSYKNNKNTGAATITIAGKGNYNGSVKKTFYIAPKAPTSLKATAGKKSTKVSYKKATGASGYQIAYSTSKTKGFKTTTTTAASKTISKLTSKKTYYVKVRAYKTINGKKYYSSYTAVKSVKIK